MQACVRSTYNTSTSTLGTLFTVGPVLHGFIWQRLPIVHFPGVSARPLGQIVNPSHSRYLKAPLFHHSCNCISDSSFGPKTFFIRTTSSCPNQGKRIPSLMDLQSFGKNNFTCIGQVFATVIFDEGIIEGPSQKVNFCIAVHGTFRARAEDWTPLDRSIPSRGKKRTMLPKSGEFGKNG